MYIEGIDPYVFQIGNFGLRWYGLLMAVSIALGIYYFVRDAKKYADEDFLYNTAFIVVIAGIIGARLVYVVTNWPDFSGNPIEIIRIDHGGISIHGGAIGGALAGWFYVKRNGFSFNRLADFTVPGLAIGIMLVRIGNIFNQEILGRMTEFDFGRHPAQIYGSAIGLILLLLHNYLARSGERPPGYLFWSFALGYSLLRGLIEETFRENPLYVVEYVNEHWGIGFVTLTQWFTPLMILFSFWMLRRTLADKQSASRST
mgnify:CR=1 FL=1